MKMNNLRVFVALALLAGVASTASATLLPIGSAILGNAEPDPTGGTTLFTTGPVAITAPTFTGTLTSTVILNDPSNPFGTGKLTFTYQIHNNNTSLNAIESMTVSSFAGFSTDGSYQSPAAGQVPTSLSRAAGIGDVVGFQFTSTPLGLGVLAPGANSALLVIQTNANSWDFSTASLIDGSVASVSSLAPAPSAGAPEPATLSVAALGAAALLLRRRRNV